MHLPLVGWGKVGVGGYAHDSKEISKELKKNYVHILVLECYILYGHFRLSMFWLHLNLYSTGTS